MALLQYKTDAVFRAWIGKYRRRLYHLQPTTAEISLEALLSTACPGGNLAKVLLDRHQQRTAEAPPG